MQFIALLQRHQQAKAAAEFPVASLHLDFIRANQKEGTEAPPIDRLMLYPLPVDHEAEERRRQNVAELEAYKLRKMLARK